MTVRTLALALAVSSCVLAGGAGATTPGGTRPRHARATHAAPAPDAVSRARFELLHGSSEQRALEQRDDANAVNRPLDHSRDEFGSEIKE